MNTDSLLKFISYFHKLVKQNVSLLNDLDNAIGDSDHGSNILRGLDNFVITNLSKKYSNTFEIWKDLAMSFLTKVGGASGPLYGSAFLEMSKTTNETDLGELLKLGYQKIKQIGKSDINEKTMLDVWEPATYLYESKNLTIEKIDELVENTKKIPAIKGRASYLGERALGHIDPGAYSTGLMFKAILEVRI